MVTKKVKVVDEDVDKEVKLPKGNSLPPLPDHSHKEHLLALYQELKDLNVRSISDLENLIAHAE